MSQVNGALLLLCMYFGTAFITLVFVHDLGNLFWKVCDAGYLTTISCQAGATTVAAQGLIAIILVVVVTVGFSLKSRRDAVQLPSIEPFEASRSLMFLFLSVLSAVLVTHNLRHDPVGLGGQHIRTSESALVSIENLTWPLLLQLVFWSRQIRWKGVLLAYLTATIAISPFRNAIFSIFYFGALVPLGTTLIFGKTLSRRTRNMGFAAIAALVLLTSLILLYQTGRRLESDQYETGPAQSHVASIETALTSRTFTPFFQAILVSNLVKLREPLPNFMATIEQKFRLGSLNLNEFIFEILYAGEGLGQATTLYYGESVANTRIPPIFWEFTAPLALVLAYFVMRPVCDIGVLIGVALWRSSMGGLFDVITALVMQVGFCVSLSYFGSRSNRQFAVAAHKHEVA